MRRCFAWFAVSVSVTACGAASGQAGQKGPGAKPPVAKQTGPDQAELVRRRDRRLQAAFLKTPLWTTDFAAARARAMRERKLLFAYFTRSYAPSPPCHEFEAGPFASERFAKLAADIVLYCHVSSKVAGEADEDLPPRLGVRSAPFLMGLDEAGRPVAAFGGQLTIDAIARFVAADILGFAKLRAQAEQGDKSAMARYLVRRIRLGHLGPAEIQQVLETADFLSAAQRAAIERGLASLEIMEILARIDYSKPEAVHRGAARLVAMKQAGRQPPAAHARAFWHVLLIYAHSTEDVGLFEEALRTIEQLPGKKPPARWVERMNHRLRALRYMKRPNDKKKTGGERK